VQSQPQSWNVYKGLSTKAGGGLANRVWLAGADYTSGFGNGYIEGAIRGGYAAAKAALDAVAAERAAAASAREL
tara:strand:- start:1835 stop:2056 length:222 start_codon:yes stop_codon:yes gene_type:complete